MPDQPAPADSPTAIRRPWMFEVDRTMYLKRVHHLRDKIDTDVKRIRRQMRDKRVSPAVRRDNERALAHSDRYLRMLTGILTGEIRPDDPYLAELSEEALKSRLNISLPASGQRDIHRAPNTSIAAQYLYEPILGELVAGEFLIFQTLARPEAGRYVLTPDLAKTLGNTSLPLIPDDFDRSYYYGDHKDELLHLPWYVERLRDLKLPHPYMTVRIPAFTLEQPSEGTVIRYEVPETDVVLVSKPVVVDFLYRMHIPAILESALFLDIPGQYPLAYSQRVRSQEQVEALANDISIIGLTPLGIQGVAYTVDETDQPEAIRKGEVVGHLIMALLMMMNEPQTQTLDRFGRVAVDPSVDRPSTRRRPPSRLRYEVLGTRTRFSAQVPGTARGPQTVRSFVRGHWARWPLMSQKDRLYQQALDCLTLLDDSAVQELVPGGDLGNPETYATAIRTCLGDVLDQQVSRRADDLGVRFLCTLQAQDERTPGLSQLRQSPAWAARASVLEERLRMICRQRRSYREPYWRGPEGGEEVSAVTILDSDSSDAASVGTPEPTIEPPDVGTGRPIRPLSASETAQAQQALRDSFLQPGHAGHELSVEERNELLNGPWWEAEWLPEELVPRASWNKFLQWLADEETHVSGYRYQPPDQYDTPILLGPDWAHVGMSSLSDFIILDGWHRVAAAVRSHPNVKIRAWLTAPPATEDAGETMGMRPRGEDYDARRTHRT